MGVSALLLTGVACSGSKDRTPSDSAILHDPVLIDLMGGTPSAKADDPFADHRPDTVDCDPTGLRAEDGRLEIRTDRCAYAALDFPVLQAIPEGTPVRATIYHTGLWAAEPAAAHVSWVFGTDTIAWEVAPPIPSETEFFVYEAPAPVTLDEGDRLHLHLHNHGSNAWTIAEFVRTDGR